MSKPPLPAASPLAAVTQTAAQKGRGAVSNSEGRYAIQIKTIEDDGWARDIERAPLRTHYHRDATRSLITYNNSPDIPFSASINPYRGCEHGCIYCFARPTHSYLDLSPGLDFETQIYCKDDAPALLRKELAQKSYQPTVLALGVNTDAYQPVEAERRITRQLLEVMCEFRQPVSIITKSTLISRDIDLLADLARDNLAEVTFSVTTLDNDVKRKLEPRAASGAARLATMKQLHEAGIPVGVLAAPMIPYVNDSELEAILAAAADCGATHAAYIFLRLPWELKTLFREWLQQHYPQRAEHVMSLVRQSRGGKDNDSDYATRMRGSGVFADLLRQRFRLAVRKHGFNRPERCQLRTDVFRVPGRAQQMDLF